MKKLFTLTITFLILCLVATPILEARGRGGGGRGGGGHRGGGHRGGGHGGRSGAHRSPSMSRSRGHQRQQPRQQPRHQARQRPQTRDRGSRGQTRNKVNDYLKNTAGSRPANKARPRDNRYRNRGDRVRDNIRKDRPGVGNRFDNKYWRRGGWNDVNRWLGWPAGGYYYYDDGYYYDDSYTNGSSTNGSYTETTYDSGTTDAAPTEPPDQIAYADQSDQWLPLGVFAMSKEGTSDEAPTVYLQLSVNKQGELTGQYLNTTTGTTYPVEGVVDQKSQRAAWQMEGSDNAPIAETGLYNLTEDQTSVRINFADGRFQDWLLVRVKKNN